MQFSFLISFLHFLQKSMCFLTGFFRQEKHRKCFLILTGKSYHRR